MAGDPQSAENGLQRWIETASREDSDDLAVFAKSAAGNTEWRRLFDAVFGNSPFLSQCAVVEPAFWQTILEDGPAAAFESELAAIDDKALIADGTDTVMQKLRRARRRVALAVGVADISGTWTDEQVTQALSRFAVSATRRVSCLFLTLTNPAATAV